MVISNIQMLHKCTFYIVSNFRLSLLHKDSNNYTSQLHFRTLIFASPIQEICPADPFRGRDVVQSKDPPDYEKALNLPVLCRLKRPFSDAAESSKSRLREKHFRGTNLDQANPLVNNSGGSAVVLIHSDEGAMSLHETREELRNIATTSQVPPSGACAVNHDAPRLQRSLTERRTKPEPRDRVLRKSFTERIDCAYKLTEGKRTNLNMETSL